MGTGVKHHHHHHHHLVNFHLHKPHFHFHHHHHPHGKKDHDHDHHDHHHHHHHDHELKDIPKGCLAIMVGHEGEELQKFVIPVIYINHPLFMQLLKEAEEVYGFDQKGPITLPCHVEDFRTVQGMIDKDKSIHHHHHHHIWCFKA